MRALYVLTTAMALGATGCGVGSAPTNRATGPAGTDPPPPAEQAVNYRYTSWAGFPKGAMLKYTTVAEYRGQKVVTETTHTLIDKTAEAVVVELRSTTTGPDGVRVPNPPDRFTNPKVVVASPGEDPTAAGRPAGKLGRGEETARAAGRDYRATWYKDRGQVEGASTVTRSWFSDEVPGGLVRSVTSVQVADGSTSTTELVEVQVP